MYQMVMCLFSHRPCLALNCTCITHVDNNNDDALLCLSHVVMRRAAGLNETICASRCGLKYGLMLTTRLGTVLKTEMEINSLDSVR